jgi:two-component system sensor histidine kinase KdpD
MPEEWHNQDRRPSPEALLEVARKSEGRTGRLKIFVGAAPGVGKTYQMLEAAQAHRQDGYDVVAGIVETHGRKETERFLDGLEAIPRRRVEYKERWLEEMDLDALIARRPQIALVDELAHTNAAGSRHPKRYLDVEELLQNGIDVYTTVNIQHIESLNDVIAQITRVRVSETVPDSIFDRADAVELVDLTPDDLIQRLKEGKVYVPEQAQRALEHFFSPANLTALRELALRRTAERVDEQLLTQMQAGAIRGPWPAGERVLVCVSEHSHSGSLVRYAKRMADRLHAPWTALHVARGRRASEEQRDQATDMLRFAQVLGGEQTTIPGGHRRLADDILAYAQANNITHIVVGKSTRSRLVELLRGSLVHELLRRAGGISVHVIAGGDGEKGVPRKAGHRTDERSAPLDLWPYGAAFLAAAASALISIALWPVTGIESADLVFLTAIVAIAVRHGLWPSVFASLVSAICYNFFFTPPYFSIAISTPTDAIAVIFFTLVAILVSNVAGRARLQAMAALNRARTTEALYSFSRKLAGVGTMDDVLWAAAYQTASMLKVSVVLLLPENGSIVVKAGYPPEDTLGDADLAAASWAWKNDRPAGRGSDTLPGAKRLFLPLRTGRGPVGIVGIDSDKPGPLLTPDERRLLDALVDQSALAIERVFLVEDMEKVRRTVETERLRSALLTSISHDLKTPLAAVLGSAETLRSLSASLTNAEKADLLGTIIDESERLNRFIANLLDMTRLESGAVAPNVALHDVREVMEVALRRADKILAQHKVELDLSAELPMLEIDPVLFEQVLFNLLDNASKYAPAGTTVRLVAWRDGQHVYLQIIDEGAGIPANDLERVFHKFYRAQKGDQVCAGTGLGLAISRGFVEAMHGTLQAQNRMQGAGAVFTIEMPVPNAPRALETAA